MKVPEEDMELQEETVKFTLTIDGPNLERLISFVEISFLLHTMEVSRRQN